MLDFHSSSFSSGFSDFVSDMFRRKSLHSYDQGKIWERMQDLCSALYRVPMVSRNTYAFQEDRSLSDLQ